MIEPEPIPDGISQDFLVSPLEQNLRRRYSIWNYRQAQIEAEQGDWLAAIDFLQDAIEWEPSQSEYYAWIAYCYWHRANLAQVKHYLQQALNINPDNNLANWLKHKIFES
jgi:tetratricopeptide (TPR) repeat protein